MKRLLLRSSFFIFVLVFVVSGTRAALAAGTVDQQPSVDAPGSSFIVAPTPTPAALFDITLAPGAAQPGTGASLLSAPTAIGVALGVVIVALAYLIRRKYLHKRARSL